MAGIGEEPSSFVSISELIKYTIEARVLPSDVRVEEFDLSRETYSFRAYEVCLP